MSLALAEPGKLAREAVRLAAVADDLRAGGARLTEGLRGTGWTGSAADAAGRRADELARAAVALADRLAELAEAVAETARRAARAAARRAEIDRWVQATPGEPGAAERERLAAAERSTLDDGWLADAARLAEVLERLDPWTLVPTWVAGAAALGRAATRARGTARKAAQLARWAREARAAGGRSAEALDALRRFTAVPEPGVTSRPAGTAGLVRGVLGRAFLPLAALDGGRAALEGGGYAGARGATTRVLGAGATASAVVLLAGATAPAVVAVTGTVLLGHAVWSTGNHVYDHRAEVAALAGRSAGAARSAARRAAATTRRLLERLGSVVVPALPVAVPW